MVLQAAEEAAGKERSERDAREAEAKKRLAKEGEEAEKRQALPPSCIPLAQRTCTRL